MRQIIPRSTICSHDITTNDLVEVCQVGRSQAAGVIPTRCSRVIQVVSASHIVERLHAVVLAGSQVEHSRRIVILVNLMDQTLVDQGDSNRPDR